MYFYIEFLLMESPETIDRIRIFSASGALIIAYSGCSQRMQIDLSSLHPSWYLVEVTIGNDVERIAMVKTE